MMIRTLRQQKDYNCGPYCLKFFLALYGIHQSIRLLEMLSKCNADAGTSRVMIRDVVKHYAGSDYEVCASDNLDILPAIVNYQSTDWMGNTEGHYGVVIQTIDGKHLTYDPEYGALRMIELNDSNWYSKRYGGKWALFLKNK